MHRLNKIQIRGFKSIESAELELDRLNVVIGANGSGKSNLIGAFRLLERVLSHNLQMYVGGNPDRLLHHGQKTTKSLAMRFQIDPNAYGILLKLQEDTLIFGSEIIEFSGKKDFRESLGAGHKESVLEEAAASHRTRVPKFVFPLVRDLVVYHFHDTSDTSPAKRLADVEDNRALRPDGANLPAYLYLLQEKHPVAFRRIEEHLRMVAPFFNRFALAPSRLNTSKIKLEWRQKGSDAYFDAFSLSDGTLRFICLATLLLSPTPPPLILLDEPELGLHPAAIHILAEMLEAASKRSQIILATQSVTLLNNFPLSKVIVAENDGQKTLFKRLDEQALSAWLGDFSLGELWEKNVIGGRP